MTHLQLLWELYRHRRLSEKRMMGLEINKAGQVMMVFSYLITSAYLMFFAFMLASAANGSTRFTSFELLITMMPFFLLVDFVLRFMVKRTPSQIIKPYLLLPIRKVVCVDMFLTISMLSYGKLMWYTFFLPYCFMSVLFSWGFGMFIHLLVLVYLLFTVNSLYYILVRTLLTRSFFYWLLPIAVYGLIAFPFYLGENPGFNHYVFVYSRLGYWVTAYPSVFYLVIFGVMALLYYINRRIQLASIMIEVGQNKQKTMRSVTTLSYFDKWGIVGQYFKLEMKSVLRNKSPRTQMILSIVICVFFCLMFVFTDSYDNPYMTDFFGVYCFGIFSQTILSQVMSYEGNYISVLMIRKENIYNLLRAKYYFFLCLLVFPLLLMSPIMISGKWDVMTFIAYFFLVAGPIHLIYFQLAVYNNVTMPLNTKLTSSSNMKFNYIPMLIAFLGYGFPITLLSVLKVLSSPMVSNLVSIALGIVVFALHPIWLKNIYKRFMNRRYDNLTSFYASKNN